MTDVNRMIRTKTVKEVFVDKGHFLLWKPLRNGTLCDCFMEEHKPEWLCKKCYGLGIVGGGFNTDLKHIWFKYASFEEVESFEVQEGTTTENSLAELMDEYVSMTFECDFHYHIYYGCIFKLEGYCWKVIRVEEDEGDEDNDGLPIPVRWSVQARKLQEFEGAYAFLQNEKEEGDVSPGPPKVVPKGEIVQEITCPKCKMKGSYNIDMASPPNQIVCANCSHIQTWGEVKNDGNEEG